MSKRVEKRKATLFEKMKKAMLLLLIQRKSIPGASGYELKKNIGKKYLYVINLLDKELESYGLKVKISLPEDVKDPSNPSEEEYDRAHFYIIPREPILAYRIKGPFNIEELGSLAACIIMSMAKAGNLNIKELEEMLESKISKFKVKRYIEKFRKLGYLRISEEGIVSLGWRTRAEIDLENLSKLLVIYKP